MSKNLKFLSLTDNSLLIQEQSFTGAEIDSLVDTGISFFDAKITHNQLYRYYFHETTKIDEVFDRIATYRRKFFEEVKGDEVLFKTLEREVAPEEVKLDATNFNYDWLRIRKFNERVSFRDRIDPVKVLPLRDSFKIGEEKVEKILPKITSSESAGWFDNRIKFQLTKGALPLQLAEPQDDLIFVGRSVLARDIVKPEERLFRKYVNILSEPDGSETTGFFESDYYDRFGNISGLVNFELTKTITRDAATFTDKFLVGGDSRFLRDKIKISSNEVLKVGKNIIAQSKVFLASDFIDPRTNTHTGLVKRFVEKFKDTDVTKFTETLLTLGNFELLRDVLKTDETEALHVNKRSLDIVKLDSSIAIKGVNSDILDVSKFNEKLLLIGKSEQFREYIKLLNPIRKSASIIAYIDPITKDVDTTVLSANRDTSQNADNFVDLHPKIPKNETLRFFNNILNYGAFEQAKDEFKTSDTVNNLTQGFNITIPVNFSQVEELSGPGRADYNEPAIVHPGQPSTNVNLHDPYYTYLWNTIHKFVRNENGSLRYPNVISTYPDVIIDNSRREDFAFADDGNGYVPGDSNPFYAPAALKRGLPVWDGIQWRYPYVISANNSHPVFNASNRRINLGVKKYTAEDFEKARKAVYDSDGVFVRYDPLPIERVAPSGDSLWESLIKSGIYVGRFQLHIRPYTNKEDTSDTKENLIQISKPKILNDNIGLFFYPNGAHPAGAPEDVKLKKSLGSRLDVSKLIDSRYKFVNIKLSESNQRPGELFKAKELIAAMSTKAKIEHDRFHAFFYPRGSSTPDVSFGHGKDGPRDIIKGSEIYSNKFRMEPRTPDKISGKDIVAAIANAQQQIIKSEKIITSSLSKNFIARSIDEGKQLLALIADGPINPYNKAPTTEAVLSKVGNSLYASYSRLETQSSYTTVQYTNLNQYTVTNIPVYSLLPYYLTGVEGVAAPYAGNFTYSTGVAYSALGGGTISAPNQPYYSNGNAAFIWDLDNEYWLMTTGIDFSSSSLFRQIATTIDSLTSHTTSTNPNLGNITISDPAGGLANYALEQNNPNPVVSSVRRYFWRYLGEIDSIFEGVAPTTGTIVGGKLYQHSNGHIFTYLEPLTRLLGGNYSGIYNLDNIPAIGGSGWVQVSYRTGASLTPPGETLSILAAQDDYFARFVQYKKEYTETIKVADPGSAYIPVYCASYFLEPYVSEAGKNAIF
jgi:hypothetical protein